MKTKKITKTIKVPEVGDKIYVPSSFSISHGSDDFAGGKAAVKRVYKRYGVLFVDIEEGNRGYNWEIIGPDQLKLRKEYKGKVAHPDPDIDTPWIEPGDTVNGVKYKGPPIW